MASADFASAQQRVAERRRQREAAARAHQAPRANASLDRLPYPFSGIAHASAATWSTIQGREGTRPALRVGQVDAELLDEELLELLKGQAGEALKYFGVIMSLSADAAGLMADYRVTVSLAKRLVQ